MNIIKKHLKKEEIISITLFIICSFAFFLMAAYKISRPGVQYDEISFYNIALGAKSEHFVSKRIFGIPVMVVPYYGALKAYIYKLIFWLFGVNIFSIRIPMILLSILSLWFIYKLMNILTGNLWISNAATAMVSTSLCFIVSSKLDWGPTTIMMFLMILALWSFFQFMDTRRLLYFYIMLLALILGIYDKSNFIWFSIAFGASAFVIYRKEIIAFVKEIKWRFIIPLAAFLFIMCIYILFSVLPLMQLDVNSASSVSIDFQRINYTLNLLAVTLTGTAYTEYLLNSLVEFNNFRNLIVISSYSLSLLFLIIGFFPDFRKRLFTDLKEHMNGFTLLYLISIIIFIEMTLTRQFSGAHHSIMLLPYTVFITALCGYTVIRTIQNRENKKIFTMIFSSVIAVILFFNIRADIWFLRYISNEENIYNSDWDPAIYKLSEYIQNTGSENIYSIDWGLHNQLYSFDSDRDKKNYYEMTHYFDEYFSKTEFEHEWYFNKFFDKPEILFVRHGSETTKFINPMIGFETLRKESLNSGVFEKIHSIQNNQGQELYQVFRYSDYTKK